MLCVIGCCFFVYCSDIYRQWFKFKIVAVSCKMNSGAVVLLQVVPRLGVDSKIRRRWQRGFQRANVFHPASKAASVYEDQRAREDLLQREYAQHQAMLALLNCFCIAWGTFPHQCAGLRLQQWKERLQQQRSMGP